MFKVDDKVKLNKKGLGWAKWSSKCKATYLVGRLTGINSREPDDRLTPIFKTLRTGRVVFCGLINTGMLVKV